MRATTVVCDECDDEADGSARLSTIHHDNGHVEHLDLCDFCRGEIEGATIVSAELLAAA